MNKVELMGRIVKDVELQKSKEGKYYIKNTLAVRKDKDNTIFVDFLVGGKPAEAIKQYAGKGDRIIVCGSLDIRDYKDKDGNSRKSTSILVNDFYFVDFKKIEDKKDDSFEQETLPF